MKLKEWIDEQKKILKNLENELKSSSKLKEEEDEEEKDNFKPVILPPKIMGKLMLKLDKYKHNLTPGQYQQCLSIWEYDPYSAIRYCKAVLNHQRKKKDKDFYVD